MADLDAALTGETPPIVTPFRDGDVDRDSLASVVEHVQAGGVDGVFACGTNGEFYSLSTDEHRAVIETVVEAADVPVLAGVAATDLDEVTTRAEQAAEAGADAVVATQPFFVTASEPEGDRAFLESVAQRSSLPLVLYNIPQHTGACLDVEAIAALADREDVVALKDSSGDLDHLMSAMRKTPEDFRVLQGSDPVLLPSLRVGADGGVNGTANVLPETLTSIVHAPQDDRADELVGVVDELFDAFEDVDFPAGTKGVLAEQGVIADDEVRPPLTPTDEATRERIADALDDLGQQ